MSFENIFIDGPVGKIEAIASSLALSPDDRVPVAIICHPHPQFDGSMHNKVVTTISKALESLGVHTVRFNYRGVGKSEGSFGNYEGEIADALSVYDYIVGLKQEKVPVWMAGFSFGSFIAASVACARDVANLITVAPAVDSSDFNTLSVSCPWLVVQGDNDEVVSPSSVYNWYDNLSADKSIIKMADTTHFFHGKLVDLRNNLEKHFAA